MLSEKKVAILTVLADLPRSYGLVPVILNQLNQLKTNGYTVDLFVQSGFEKHPDAKQIPDGINIVPSVPFIHLYDYTDNTPEQKNDVDAVGLHHKNGNITNFKKQVDLIEEKLAPELSKYSVIITHDIIYQTWFTVHNKAIRNIASRYPDIKWLHWLHSGPSPRPDKIMQPAILRYSPFPNSVLVSPNDTMRRKFAIQYDMPLNRVKTVYHTIDPVKFYDMHDMSVKILETYDLINCEGLAVWATRIDHPEPKGMYKAMRLLGQLNKFGDYKILFLNSWSNTDRAREVINSIKREAKSWGVPDGNVMFSSEVGKEFELGVPKQVVRDMTMIGDMYIFPSESETFGLNLLEAALCKNMLMINEDLEVLTELCGNRAEYFKTGSLWGGTRITTTYNPDEKQYWLDRAQEFHGLFKSYKPLQQHRYALQTFNDKWVFNNQLLPLLNGDW